MQRTNNTTTNQQNLVSEDIFDIASQFPNAVVQQFAKDLHNAGVTKESFQRDTIVAELVASGLPPIPAADIVAAFRRHFKPGPVGVYWDIENIGLPSDVSPMEAVTALREKIMANFGDVLEFKAYMDLEMYAKKYSSGTRVVLADSGLSIVDAAHGGISMKRKEVADKMIIVDALMFALTHENPTICIISADSDFSPLLAKLKMRGIRTVVVTTVNQVRSLRQQATFALSWPMDFIPDSKDITSAPQRNMGAKHPRADGAVSPNRSGGGARGGSPNRSPYRQQQQSSHQPQTPIHVRSSSGDASSISSSSAPNINFFASPQDIENARFADLKDSIRRAQLEAGTRKVRRSKVGQYLKQMNPMASLKILTEEAVDKGIIKAGGVLGNAWISLGSDDVNLSDDESNYDDFSRAASTNAPSTIGTGGEGGMTGAKSSEQPPPTDTWYLTLRYSNRFPSFLELNSFTDRRVSFLKRVQENATFRRMSIGTFSSIEEADSYFQRNFGHLNVRPKFTPEPLLDVSNKN